MKAAVIIASGMVLTACGAAPLEAVTVDPRSLAMGLVAHWTFDEGSGTAVGDHSGNGHDGQLTGGSWTGAGRFGGALQLASGDYVTVSNFPQATPNWTVSVWIQLSPAQLAADTATNDYGTILSTEITFMGGWQVQLDERPGYQRFDASFWAGSASSGDYVVNDCPCIVTDQWIHLTAVFDHDADQFTLYQGNAVAGRMAMPSSIQSGDATLYMGRWNQNQRFLDAGLDDFAIWSRALTAGEVAVLSQQSPPD
jgi:hypothetical protein